MIPQRMCESEEKSLAQSCDDVLDALLTLVLEGVERDQEQQKNEQPAILQ